MLPRYRDTRGMDHVSLYSTPREPARQPKPVAASFEGQRNPRDGAAGLDRFVAPAVQQRKQPFWARLQLLARLTLNAGKHTANQPARLAHLDDGNDRAIVVQGDEGPAQVIRLGHRGTPSVDAATKLPCPRRPPHSIYRSPKGEPLRGSKPANRQQATVSKRHPSDGGPIVRVQFPPAVSQQTFGSSQDDAGCSIACLG